MQVYNTKSKDGTFITDAFRKTLYDDMLADKAARADVLSKLQDTASMYNAPLDFRSNLLKRQREDLSNESDINQGLYNNDIQENVLSRLANEANRDFIINSDVNNLLNNKSLSTLKNKEILNNQIIATENSDNAFNANNQYNTTQISPLARQNEDIISRIRDAVDNKDYSKAEYLNNLLKNNLLETRSLSEQQQRYDRGLEFEKQASLKKEKEGYSIPQILNKTPERNLGTNSNFESISEFANGSNYTPLNENSYYKKVGENSYNILVDLGEKKYKSIDVTAEQLSQFFNPNNNVTNTNKHSNAKDFIGNF